MLFNSVEFLLFFVVVTSLFFTIKDKWRWLLLLVSSYIFYGSWSVPYLGLIVGSTLITFYSGILLGKQNSNTGLSAEHRTKNKRRIVAGSLILNFGILVFFKYYNFLAETINFMAPAKIPYSNLLLPVGISFYVFQATSYTLDVYKEKIQPESHLGKYALFVSFFPQLVAGPIEKAVNLLPQVDSPKAFEYERVRSGCLLMLWGLFKKVVVADRLGLFVTQVYGDVEQATGLIPVIATFFFTIQVYLDFSAYSEIAIGAARILGFNLTTNFKRPFLASSFNDLWRRWHISLTSWFLEYLYIPLGGSRSGKAKTIRNILIVFLISGLWHGPSWNFIIWGAINGLFVILLDRILDRRRKGAGKRSLLSKVIKGGIITSIWAVPLVFFRAETFDDALTLYANTGLDGLESIFDYGLNRDAFLLAILLFAFIYLIELLQEMGWEEQRIWNLPLPVRWSIYLALALSIIYLGAYGEEFSDSAFFYFQF